MSELDADIAYLLAAMSREITERHRDDSRIQRAYARLLRISGAERPTPALRNEEESGP